MVSVTIFIEGGAPGPSAASLFKKGFRKFFEKMHPGKDMPTIVPCHGRAEAYRDFCKALNQLSENDYLLLLVDSEGPVLPDADPWLHCGARKGDEWAKPQGAVADDLHLMVQTVESWFLADPEALRSFYGGRFKPERLPRAVNGKNIEVISKDKVFNRLNAALKEVNKDGYQKSDGFEIMAEIDPDRVCQVSFFARRLRTRLEEILADSNY